MRLKRLGLAALLCGCAGPVVAPYGAQSTLEKLAHVYPFISAASDEVPSTVTAVRNISYVLYAHRSLQLDLYLPALATAAPVIAYVHGGA